MSKPDIPPLVKLPPRKPAAEAEPESFATGDDWSTSDEAKPSEDAAKHVYIAGPLFTPAERTLLEELAGAIEAAGFVTYLPHRDGGLAAADRRNTRAFYDADIRGLDACGVIIAVLNGADVDSGTAFEIGYGVARGVPVLGLYEDLRVSAPHDFNVMIVNGCRVFSDRQVLIENLKGLETRD
jgi:nucleoside 2-deoxyribosyltransferase